MRTILLSYWLVCYSTIAFAQTTTTLAYDENGNRISKKMQGSSRHPEVTANPQVVTPPSQPATLEAIGCPANGIVRWSTNQTGPTIQVIPQATSTYSATCVVAGCASNGVGKVTVGVTQCQSDEITVVSNATFVRYGQAVSLSAFGCTGMVEWSTGQIGNSVIVNVYGPVTQFTATCTKPYCPNAGSASAYVSGTTGCATGDVLITLKSGNWNDPSVWTCNRVPTLNDEVYLAEGHIINVNVTGYAKLIIGGGGRLDYPATDSDNKIVFPSN